MVVGNKKGRVGVAVSSSKEMTDAVAKASLKAEPRVIRVPLTRRTGTIPHVVSSKFKGAKVGYALRRRGLSVGFGRAA